MNFSSVSMWSRVFKGGLWRMQPKRILAHTLRLGWWSLKYLELILFWKILDETCFNFFLLKLPSPILQHFFLVPSWIKILAIDSSLIRIFIQSTQVEISHVVSWSFTQNCFTNSRNTGSLRRWKNIFHPWRSAASVRS